MKRGPLPRTARALARWGALVAAGGLAASSVVSGCLNPRPEELPSAIALEPSVDEAPGAGAGSPVEPRPVAPEGIPPGDPVSFPDEDDGAGVPDGGPLDAGADAGASSEPGDGE
jgi:hypothetical protein